MKRRTGILSAIAMCAALATAAAPSRAEAAPFIVGWGGEKIITVAELPGTAAFKSGDTHFDLGYRFKQITFFFIPVWNYDGKWCGSIRGDGSHFFDFDRERLEKMARAADISLPAEPAISAWDSYGGKALVGAIILGYGVLRWRGRRAAKPAVA
jgi:hypothetical protein